VLPENLLFIWVYAHKFAGKKSLAADIFSGHNRSPQPVSIAKWHEPGYGRGYYRHHKP
jgi:hypothetical protein